MVEAHRVHTCPVCVDFSLTWGPLAEALAQGELFEDIDREVSVSGLVEVEDGLPF